MSLRDDTVWAALPAACLLVDRENCVSAANPAAEVFLNSSERTMTGRAIQRLMPTDVDLVPALERARAGQSAVVHNDVRLLRGPRGPVICDVQIGPFGETPDVVLVMIHPRQIAGRLGKALQAKSVAKTAIGLADMLAHEIKNPLAGITGAAQLLSMSLGKEDQEMTDLILQETRRIVALLAQVEQFGDLRPPNLQPANIHDVIERARMSAALGAAKKMTFKDEYDPSLPATLADTDQLLQVFANLFANAAEAAGEAGGTITIRTFFEGGLRLAQAEGGEIAVPLQIEIIDDGPGIPETLIDSVFEPFVSSRENGTGLGLALVSKIVAAHRGSIVVSSRPGRTAFRISLPIQSTRGDA